MRSPLGSAFVALAALLAVAQVAIAQQGDRAAIKVDVLNVGRETVGQPLARGNWVAFFDEEWETDLNNDGDIDDTFLYLARVNRLQIIDTKLIVDSDTSDDPDDWAVDINADGTWAAVLVSEPDSGETDLNGDGQAEDEILHLYDIRRRRATNLHIEASRPLFWGNKLLFSSDESVADVDYNADGDKQDEVLLVYDMDTGRTTNTGIECVLGYEIQGEWAVCQTSEAEQGRTDLNGDGDLFDIVIQLYNITTGEKVNTGLDASHDYAATPDLVASVILERRQGMAGEDFNGDGDLEDNIVRVFDIAKRESHDLKYDGSDGLAAHGKLLAFVANERLRDEDLNQDGDKLDSVAFVYSLETHKVTPLGRDASEGIGVLAHSKVVFVSSERNEGRDLNGDRDREDFVLQVYDAARNVVLNTRHSVDSDLFLGDEMVAFLMLEEDQNGQDFNGDGDVDDDIACVYHAGRHQVFRTREAAIDVMSVGSWTVAIVTAEDEQGEMDLNRDGEMDDEILQVIRLYDPMRPAN